MLLPNRTACSRTFLILFSHFSTLTFHCIVSLLVDGHSCSTWPENLVNKLGYLPNTFCTHNVQNVSKKKRGKNLFSKSSPRISLIISIFQVIPPQLPARRQGGRLAHGMENKMRSSCQSWRRTSRMMVHRHVHHRYQCACLDERHVPSRQPS